MNLHVGLLNIGANDVQLHRVLIWLREIHSCKQILWKMTLCKPECIMYVAVQPTLSPPESLRTTTPRPTQPSQGSQLLIVTTRKRATDGFYTTTLRIVIYFRNSWKHSKSRSSLWRHDWLWCDIMSISPRRHTIKVSLDRCSQTFIVCPMQYIARDRI